MLAPARGSAALSRAGREAAGKLRTLGFSGLLLELTEPLPLDLEIVIGLEVAAAPARVRDEGRVAYAGGVPAAGRPLGQVRRMGL